MVLDATLKADYSPGSNKSGDMACADWRFLLPQLSMGIVVSIGIPRLSAIRILSQFAREVHVLSAKIERGQAENLNRFANVYTSTELADERNAQISAYVDGSITAYLQAETQEQADKIRIRTENKLKNNPEWLNSFKAAIA